MDTSVCDCKYPAPHAAPWVCELDLACHAKVLHKSPSAAYQNQHAHIQVARAHPHTSTPIATNHMYVQQQQGELAELLPESAFYETAPVRLLMLIQTQHIVEINA